MNQSIYSKIIGQLRTESGMNQAEIAKLLGVSQATISRIEKSLGMPRGRLADKIRGLPLKHSIFDSVLDEKTERIFDLNKEIKTLSFKPFDISYLSIGYSKISGDLCLIKKFSQEKLALLLADCVGHGAEVGKMTFALRFGFETAVGLLNSGMLSPTVINNTLIGAVDATHEAWSGPPAFVSSILDIKKSQIRLLNNMQPQPLLFVNGEVVEASVTNGEQNSQFPKPEEFVLTMKAGSSLLFCSDGLVDLFDGSKQIKDRLLKSAKAFKGDSKAILIHLMTGAKGVSKDSVLDSKVLADDISVMIITRGRD